MTANTAAATSRGPRTVAAALRRSSSNVAVSSGSSGRLGSSSIDFVERRRGGLQPSSLERGAGGIQPAVDAAALGALLELRVAIGGGRPEGRSRTGADERRV